jgi:hypothetical protein
MKYTVAIETNRSQAEVFHYLTHEVDRFWPEDFEGASAQLNDEFTFSTGETHYSKNRVSELIPDQKLVWLVTESIRKTDGFDWTGTAMTFELTPKGDCTQITFTYDGPVLHGEEDRLTEICDFVIKEKLYQLLTSFSLTVQVNTSPETVFQKLAEVPKWWSTDFEGSSTNLDDEFVICHPGAHYSKKRLMEVIPGQKIVWLVTESKLDWLKNQEEWTGTKMIFELTAKGGGTELRFTHEGLVPEKECFDKCSQGWSYVIKDLLYHYISNN